MNDFKLRFVEVIWNEIRYEIVHNEVIERL